MDQQTKQTQQVAMHVSWVSIAVNIALSLLKLIAGLLANSGAMISDAIHSASDVFSTIIVMAGIRIAGKRADADHPYGHERLECVASIVLSMVLFATGIGVGLDGISKIQNADTVALAIPGALALVAALVSIAAKEWMYHFTKRAAKQINSTALLADAWHHRSDALSSIGAFIGILGARMGFPILDPVASLVICCFIGKAAYDIFHDAMSQMVDKACDERTERKITVAALQVSGVERIDLLRTRMFGARAYVEIEISANGDLTLVQSHAIAEQVHDAIESAADAVKHCTVHVNPI